MGVCGLRDSIFGHVRRITIRQQVVGSSNLTMDEQRPENRRVMVIQALIVKVMLLLNNRNYMFSSLEA